MIGLEVPACPAETSEKATGKESKLTHKCIMHECINSVKRNERNAGDEEERREQPGGNLSAWHSCPGQDQWS